MSSDSGSTGDFRAFEDGYGSDEALLLDTRSE